MFQWLTESLLDLFIGYMTQSTEQYSPFFIGSGTTSCFSDLLCKGRISSDSMTWSGVLLNSYLICFFI